MARRNKGQKPKWRQEGSRWVATLPNSLEDQLKAHRRASREDAKAAGMLGHASGSGVHGGGKKERNRRSRHETNANIRQGRFED
jgi:hypothetical protein